MEEDIKILEEMKFWEGCESTIDEKWCRAFENLLKRYKELEEMLKHRIKYTRELEEDLFENARNYVIPISVIQNKIEELETNRDMISGGYAISILQELLKENK